ncbi:hypothetical protein DPEC_G00158550 [Dallia pectoralis]|uniref:Uncharacterized protein n=1 Tax=Dallia pectoralis TaxID=75939 RepID=A0ACC2GL50_DALPE|nr:hypothetical protein DPEC_G00158550 [Dallia pectoralis]
MRCLLALLVFCITGTANTPLSMTAGMLTYSVSQLKKFNNSTTPPWISVIKGLGLIRRPRYIHRSYGRKFVFARSDHNISPLWSVVRTVASQTRHQDPASSKTSNAGVPMATLRTDRNGKYGKRGNGSFPTPANTEAVYCVKY